MTSIRWLTRAMVESMHRESIARFGGEDGIRDVPLLESAIARPRNLAAYDSAADLFSLAASYCAGIVRNHPFVDGNKRAGLLAAAVFLALNGYRLRLPEAEIVERIDGLAAGRVAESDLAPWLARHAMALGDG